jgi:glycogen debranching enzyme
MGNISDCYLYGSTPSMGMFCRDTRFLSRLELQIEGRSPILLSSNADKGFALSVLCTNPDLENLFKADTVGIRRELVLNGALFEEIEVANYNTTSIVFELSLSFDADFVDLFEVRGHHRQKRGRLLHLNELTSDHVAPSSPQTHKEESLTLAYQGLDASIMESLIQFQHLQPTRFHGSTAVWRIELASHETKKLGYRLNMFTDNQPSSTISAASTLAQAKAAELMEEQNWLQQITRISSDKSLFNRVISRAEQDIYLLLQSFGKHKTVSAGVPWFSTLFGRDSIITASQTLMLNSKIAKETLILLMYMFTISKKKTLADNQIDTGIPLKISALSSMSSDL